MHRLSQVVSHGLQSTRPSGVAARGPCCSLAGGILVPQPRIEPMSPVLQGRFLTTGPQELLMNHLFIIRVSLGECFFLAAMCRGPDWFPQCTHPFHSVPILSRTPLCLVSSYTQQFFSVQFSRSVMSHSLRPHEPQCWRRQTRHYIKKQGHHFADKGPCSQSNDFSSSHIRM